MVFPTIIRPLCGQNKTKLDICALRLKVETRRQRRIGWRLIMVQNRSRRAREPAAARDRIIAISVAIDRIKVGGSRENVSSVSWVRTDFYRKQLPSNRQWLSKYDRS